MVSTGSIYTVVMLGLTVGLLGAVFGSIEAVLTSSVFLGIAILLLELDRMEREVYSRLEEIEQKESTQITCRQDGRTQA